MTTVLCVAGFACIAIDLALIVSGLNTSGRNGAAVVLLTAVYWGLPLVAACYLFTLATGWTP